MTAGRVIRIALVVLGIWITLVLVSLWLFDSGGTVPGEGRGEPITDLKTTP